MNTRKTIEISMIALLVVALSVSMAAAESIVVSPDNQELQPNQTPPGGVYSTYNIEVTQIVGSTSHDHTIYAKTTGVAEPGSLDDLKFRFNHGSTSSVWLNSGNTWIWDDGGSATASLTVDVMDTGSATDVTYQLKVYDRYQNGMFEDDAHGTVYGTSPIPEFTTLAIPVIALLGLVLFMRRKKQK